MAQLLKDKYTHESLCDLAGRVRAAYPAFEAEDFIHAVVDESWEGLALKARMRHISIQLGRYLPAAYNRALGILDRVVADYPEGFNDFTLMFFPDFVEVHGQEEGDWDLSMAALARYTPLSSSEFAVRPFILRDEMRMMAQMAAWARHENEHVRRLASEGCRPALPWGQALPRFKEDPTPVLKILELLKADPSLYVRKSVANNLNDISKTHPNLVAGIAQDWHGDNPYTDWIVKHGCRTLLKKGHRETLALFGFGDSACVNTSGFGLKTASVCIGQPLRFGFAIETDKATRVRLEYGVDYVKANGRQSRKIFQISELSAGPGEMRHYTKAHSFADTSTRKHYPGTHAITLIVNGAEQGRLDFEVLPAE